MQTNFLRKDISPVANNPLFDLKENNIFALHFTIFFKYLFKKNYFVDVKI